MNILQSIGSFIATTAIAVSSFFGFPPATPVQAPSEPVVEAESQRFGAALPAATAVFETSLAAPISSSATSLTITANSVRGGGSVSGYTCFTIDEGTAQAETVCGTLSGTSMTSVTRGISQADGMTPVTALQFSHRRGANVKITDFPLVQILKAQANGDETYPNQLLYASGTTPSVPSALTDKEYVDGLAFSGAGVINADTSNKGVVQIATGAQVASSTSTGTTGATLVIPASVSTTTYNAATAPYKIPVTGADGKLDNNFIATSTLFATSSLYASPIGYVGKNFQIITASSTFSVPSGVRMLAVELQGSGGNGGACSSGGSPTGNDMGGGGGSGGWAFEMVDVSATTSVAVIIGNTPGGTTSFGNFLSVTGGGSGSEAVAGTPGTATGGDINVPGTYGEGLVNGRSGLGASSRYGSSGATQNSNSNGSNASGYGAGASGAACSSSSQTFSGGLGASAFGIIRW